MPFKPLVMPPLHTLGGQLAAMALMKDLPNSVAALDSHWHVVEAICGQHEIPSDSLGERPVKDDDVSSFKRRFIDVLRPRLDNALFTLANRPTSPIMHWQSLNPSVLYQYVTKGIITGSAFQALNDATDRLMAGVRKAKKKIPLGQRIRILSEYLMAHYPPSVELNAEMNDLLRVYGLPRAIMVASSFAEPDTFMEIRMRVLELVQPRIENDIMSLVLQLPSSQTLDGIGLSEQLLIDAAGIGAITEEAFIKISSLMPRLTHLADAKSRFEDRKAVFEKTEAVLTDQLATNERAMQLSVRVAMGATALNTVLAVVAVLSGALALAGPLFMNAAVGGIITLIGSGAWRPGRRRRKASPEKPAIVITSKEHTSDDWQSHPTYLDIKDMKDDK